jgi:hypothetical protein
VLKNSVTSFIRFLLGFSRPFTYKDVENAQTVSPGEENNGSPEKEPPCTALSRAATAHAAYEKTGSRSCPLFENVVLSAAALCKALGAIDRLVVSRLERHLGRLAAGCANGVEHLAGLLSARCVLAGLPAFRAADGVVFEIVSCVKFLLARAENEFLAAVSANQCSVFVHDVLFSLRELDVILISVFG